MTRFREVIEKLKMFLKHAGFKVSTILFSSYFLYIFATRIQISAISPALA